MQGIGERTIREGEGIDLGVIGDEGSTACTIVKAPFETLLREATTDEASGSSSWISPPSAIETSVW